MIKVLVFCALVAFASCDWLGDWVVTGTQSVDYSDCDLPPVSSTATFSANPVGGMLFTRVSTTEGKITDKVDWSDNENVANDCSESWDWCISGQLLSTTNATVYIYYVDDQSVGCQIELYKGSTPPPPPPPVVSWVGSWTVKASQPANYCHVPEANTQVTITAAQTGLLMTGTDAQTLSATSWTLNWDASNLNPAQTCANYLCTSGSLTSQGNTLTASLNWVEDTLYACNAVLTSTLSS